MFTNHQVKRLFLKTIMALVISNHAFLTLPVNQVLCVSENIYLPIFVDLNNQIRLRGCTFLGHLLQVNWLVLLVNGSAFHSFAQENFELSTGPCELISEVKKLI